MSFPKSVAYVEAVLSALPFKNICVVGDLIVDHYRVLKAKRLSPEAPIPIFEPQSEEFKAGGAGNVAQNLCALGVGKVHLITVIGRKNFGNAERIDFSPNVALIAAFENDRLTTVKERLTTLRQQVVRVDIQSGRPILPDSVTSLLKASLEVIQQADAVVFSDYDHGVCVPELVAPILHAAMIKNIPVIVDSKAKDTLTKYRGSTIALPNSEEAKLMTKLDDFEDEHVARFLLKTMRLKAAAVTLGPRGILLATQESCAVFPPLNTNVKQDVVDVTGAGDTVAATVAAGLCTDMPLNRIVKLANVTAGIKVQKRGVATATPKEILEAIELHGLDMGDEDGTENN